MSTRASLAFLNPESTALLTKHDPPLVRVKQVMYALHHRVLAMRQSRIPESGHSAYRARNVRPCHRCRPCERPHCLPVRELQHIFLHHRSSRLIYLERGLTPPIKPGSCFSSRRRTSSPSSSPSSAANLHRRLGVSKDVVHVNKHHYIYLAIIKLAEHASICF